MTQQLDRLKQKISLNLPQGQEETEVKVGLVEPMAKSFSQKLKEALVSRMDFSDDNDKKEAEQLILHLCSKLVDNQQVFATFQNNLGNAVKIVTQILALKLPIGDTNMYYLVPYKDTLQLQVSYQGMIEVAYRSGIKLIHSKAVRANDVFELQYGNTISYSHIPNLNNPGEVVGYYAMAKLNGDILIDYMTLSEINTHRAKFAKKAKDERFDVWTNNFDAMAKKTVIKKVLKLCPKSAQLASALKADDDSEIPE